MKCQRCEGKSRVVDTEPQVGRIRRRRQCKECGYRWTTYEIRGCRGNLGKHDALLDLITLACDRRRQEPRPLCERRDMILLNETIVYLGTAGRAFRDNQEEDAAADLIRAASVIVYWLELITYLGDLPAGSGTAAPRRDYTHRSDVRSDHVP